MSDYRRGFSYGAWARFQAAGALQSDIDSGAFDSEQTPQPKFARQALYRLVRVLMKQGEILERRMRLKQGAQ